jgi:hypothetical protein
MSKWRDATTAAISARKTPVQETTSSDAVRVRRFFPLLLLVSVLVWVWSQLPNPLPDYPRKPGSGFEQDAQGEPATVNEEEPESTIVASTSEEPPTGAPVLEPELPVGGFSPLDWRPRSPLIDRPAQLRSWYENHDGYIRALRRRSHVNKPMVLFFRADWCPWSRQFESDFLLNRDVANWNAEQIRVVFDVDAGPDEATLVQKLGVTGLPAFFVVPVGARDVVRIDPFPEGTPLSIDEFLLQCRSAL